MHKFKVGDNVKVSMSHYANRGDSGKILRLNPVKRVIKLHYEVVFRSGNSYNYCETDLSCDVEGRIAEIKNIKI